MYLYYMCVCIYSVKGVIGISFPEAPTMKACCQYLADVLSKKDKYKQLDQIVPVLAPQLYDILLKV